ncbi:MAG: tRNA (adenosine(37)-N6)-threonylcarbamoyltransferase complex transferase subunit TsaD [Deltaproteobacteria bacterium]|nr:tRNA (adenosine(37)-N6)-threonylcarbamoyltransferase complex transferase subunit TsaD [Deltaproteobacteria bacterium]
MLILGIESSCDDTAAAVVEDGRYVLSSVVSSQDMVHAPYGGVVPELASRRHIEMIIPVVEEALSKAGVTLKDIGGIAVTQGPGLVGSILIGLSFAKAVSYTAGLPFTGVNHIEAHPHAAFLIEGRAEKEVPRFPLVALIVSGGHTTLLHLTGFTEYRIIGQTLDDAAGEAFDKVAKLLGLGYPGGVAIDRLAKEGNRKSVEFTRPFMAKGNLDFSFSGVKTAVLNYVKGHGLATGPEAVKDLAASFQESVVDVLVGKALWALEATGASDLVVAGGVACNSRLRTRLTEAARDGGFRLFIPPPRFCSDNGAMIASLGYHQLKKGAFGTLDMDSKPTWEGF